jgi:hypothetical protein
MYVSAASTRTPNAVGGAEVPPLTVFPAPLGWEHINLTGDYAWRQSKQVE